MEEAIEECKVYLRMGALDERIIADIADDFDLDEVELHAALQSLGMM